MYQLLYISNAVNLMSNEELEALLDKARIKNRELNITGMLVYHEGSFIQILEGEEAIVKDSFESISKDPRHNDIMLIDEHSIDKRSFESWEMAFHQLHFNDIERFPAIKNLLDKSENNQTTTLTDIVESFLELTVA